jgi:NADH-quinone oxidoreductase subunit J
MGNPIVFGALAIVALISAGMMLWSRNAVYSALWLVMNFTTIAVLYLILNAPFIAMVQVTVYAGAIMVLFLFVIMLLGAEKLRGVSGTLGNEVWHQALAGVLVVILVASFAAVLLQGDAVSGNLAGMIDSSPERLGLRLFEAYVLPFEVTGVLLLAAIIGVAVFGKRKKSQTEEGA